MSLEACAHEKWCGFLGGAGSAHEKFRSVEVNGPLSYDRQKKEKINKNEIHFNRR